MKVSLKMKMGNMSIKVSVVNAPPTPATFFAILDFNSMLIDITKKMASRNVHEN